MTKIAALDLGDQWVGIALSDPLGILAKPYKTVALADLHHELTQLCAHEGVTVCIVGNPKTMKGTDSDQTRTVHAQTEALRAQFPAITFTLWDERLSSQRAQQVKPAKNSVERNFAHARAAAFILDSYLTFLAYQKNQNADAY